ncbi:MAG: hypothetical protein ACFFAJ_13405 [Candidatus Hodarchaeota archaeon]
MSCETIYRNQSRKGYYTKIINVLVVVAVLMAVPFVHAFSTPSMTPVIVNMDHTSPETQITIAELQKEIPAIKVNYNSLRYMIETLRTNSIMIFVGHGSSQGIDTKKDIVGYQQLVSKNIAPVNIFAACYSIEATKLNTAKTILGFEGQIDGILAANSISYYIGKSAPQFAKNENTSERAANNFIQRLVALENGQSEILLMFEVDGGGGGGSSSSTPYMSNEEWLWFGVSLIITICVQALLIWGIPWIIARYGQRFVNALSNAFSRIFRTGTSGVSLLARIAQMNINGVTIASIVNIASLILRILFSGVTKVLEAVINTANLFDWLVVGISLAASIYAIFQTGTTSFLVGLGIALWPVYKVVMNGIKNFLDPDGTWNQYYVAWFRILMLY